MKELEHWRRTVLENIHRATGIFPLFAPMVVADLLAQQAQREASQEPESYEV